MKPKFLISIVGPTGIGKTSLAIKIANAFRTEIISADSRQFYREMTIGTAVPTVIELEAAKHHFIHHKSIEDNYSVGAFERDAIAKLNALFQIHSVVVMVGGSGLYVDAVTKGLDEFPKVEPKFRAQLNAQLKTDGLETLQMQLKQLDPKAYNTIAINNPHRVIRALEVCLSSGTPYSSFLSTEIKRREFQTITIGLKADRHIIYDRINTRVDLMIDAGLLDEVKTLISKKYLNALNTVGYKELFEVIEHHWSLDFAIAEIKKNTRRFAKRQLTWFKRNLSTIWFDHKTDVNLIMETLKQNIEEKQYDFYKK